MSTNMCVCVWSRSPQGTLSLNGNWNMPLATRRVCGSPKYCMYACVYKCATVILCVCVKAYNALRLKPHQAIVCPTQEMALRQRITAFSESVCIAHAAKHVKILYGSQYLEIEANADFSHTHFSALRLSCILFSVPLTLLFNSLLPRIEGLFALAALPQHILAYPLITSVSITSCQLGKCAGADVGRRVCVFMCACLLKASLCCTARNCCPSMETTNVEHVALFCFVLYGNCQNLPKPGCMCCEIHPHIHMYWVFTIAHTLNLRVYWLFLYTLELIWLGSAHV